MSALIIGSLITVAAFRGTLFPSSSSSSFSLTVTATAFQFPLGHPLSRIAAATFSRTSSSSSVRPPTIQLFSSSSSSSSSSSPADAFTKRTADNDNNIADTFKSYLYNPIERDEHYQGNIAQYLLDLHNEGATFDFCGGMIFQLVLSDKLISHLEPIASSYSCSTLTNEQQTNQQKQQPCIHPASQSLMSRIPNYNKSSFADNRSIFHGREIRKVSNANGGMGFVLQLSYADDSTTATTTTTSTNVGAIPTIVASSSDTTTATTTESSLKSDAKDIILPKGANAIWSGQSIDPQGWSLPEITAYDGWRSDTFRQWRNAHIHESEAIELSGGGYANFSIEMGKEAYGLHHRFFLHYDDRGRMWLCAEDGCEGTPIDYAAKKRGGLFGKLLDGMMFGK